jgi:predicted kinase
MKILLGLIVWVNMAFAVSFDVAQMKKDITEELGKKLTGKASSDPFVLLVGGYPGAGKTTLIQEVAKSHEIAVIALNDVRQCLLDRKVKGSAYDWEIIESVYQQLLKTCLERQVSVVIDTNAHAQRIQEITSFLQQDPQGQSYRLLKILLNPPNDTLFSRVRARRQLEGVHQGTVEDLQRDLALPFKKIDSYDYDLIIDTDKTPLMDELDLVNAFLATKTPRL